MRLSRRKVLAGAAGGAGVLAVSGKASASGGPRREFPGVLVDATRCVGCRACEVACSEVNHLPEPVLPGDPAVFDTPRETTPTAFSVVNRFPGEGEEPRFIKRQCMHCVEPACASACPVKALEKTAAGPVVYHEDRCIGCRYCMVACPFGVPKYEYEKAAPFVRKCSFCAERQAQGLAPACATVCPSGALTFGKRDELLDEAKIRVYQSPEKYLHRVYGEHEAGGTSWLYIADVPFEQLGLKTDVGERPYTELTQGALSAVPFVLTLWPPFLMGLYSFTKRREQVKKAEQGHDKEPHHG
ncbi:MAG: 4Fe-4S dicluster domain-containing protein [Myxococcaceae bacterium]